MFESPSPRLFWVFSESQSAVLAGLELVKNPVWVSQGLRLQMGTTTPGWVEDISQIRWQIPPLTPPASCPTHPLTPHLITLCTGS